MRFVFSEVLQLFILSALSLGVDQLFAEGRTINHLEPGINIKLGQGYLAETDELKSSCVTGERVFVKDNDAWIGFENALSRDQLNEDITAKFTGGINVFIASAKVTNKLSSLINEEAYKRKFVYKSAFKTKTEKLIHPRPDSLGQRLIELHDSNLSLANCGKEFVEEIKHGGELYIVLEFDFANKEILNEISTRIEFSFLGLKSVREFSKTVRQHRAAIRVNVDAFQIGGSPQRLQEVLAKHPNSSCRLDDLNACDQLIQSLMNYATAPDGFVAQLENSSPLSFVTAPYVERSMSQLIDTASPLFKAEQIIAYQDLSSWYNREDKKLRKIDELIASPLVGRHQRNQLYFARDSIDANVSLTLKGLAACELTPTACAQNRDQVAVQLLAMDEALLTPLRNFFYYCRKQDPDNAAGIQAVLRALNVTDCQTAEDNLGNVKVLNLRNLNLLNIEFLRSMIGLQTLDVSRNELSNLYALSSMLGLQTLNSSRNTLDSIAGLEKLTNLKSVNVSRNNITTLSPLLPVRSLKFLSAYMNFLNPEELVGKFPGVKSLYSLEDACNFEISKLLSARKIDGDTAELYQAIRFGPNYLPGGAIEWVDCEVAAESFE